MTVKQRQVELYDTTLRDGTQGEGISLSVTDKLQIVEQLDALGIHFIEGGWPGSNPKDVAFFQQAAKLRLKSAKIVAFGSTHRAGRTPSKDVNLKALLKVDTEVVTVFGKSWDFHVKDVLRISLDDNLRLIANTVAYLRKRNRRVIYDAEHFFDGYQSNPEYAMKALRAAEEAGCETLVLCDTNGGTITSDLNAIVRRVCSEFDTRVGIHTHNDSELGVANAIVAVEAGANQVQGTVNGIGERCGNANLCSIIANLCLKLNIPCVSKKQLRELTEVSRFVAEMCNMRQAAHQPFVGRSAFAHKGGVHINAVLKKAATYEHVTPESVGNQQRILMSELAGRTAIALKAKQLALDLSKSTPTTKKILTVLQDLEHEGYQFEAAEASFELLMRRGLGECPSFFELEGFRVSVEKREDNQLISEATIKVRVGQAREHTAAEGDGPVNALDNALRKALESFYPILQEMHLVDFKVRVLDAKSGTAAKVRVLIQSQDAQGSWNTIGVSENIIEASWQALVDSIEYKLLKERVSSEQ